MSTDFDKYEGLGNDFIVIEATAPISADRARSLCDRHYGVGGDGVLVLLPAQSAEARARMLVLNADGTRPEMCGNGLRCVALHLAERDAVGTAEYLLETDAGLKTCSVRRREEGTAEVVLGMGRAELMGNLTVVWEGSDYIFARVSMGNPHAVLLDAEASADVIDRLAPQVSQAISGGANVEFVQPRPDRAFGVSVWERGVGRTLACGTGAAAAAVALADAGRVDFGAWTTLLLPGGPLELLVDSATLEVTLRGPARHVFSGQLPS